MGRWFQRARVLGRASLGCWGEPDARRVRTGWMSGSLVHVVPLSTLLSTHCECFVLELLEPMGSLTTAFTL